jgi:dTDP-4-dehydrorhamnose reductase
MQRVLIVGASSLLGAHIALRLRDRHLVTGTFDLHAPGLRGLPTIRLPLREGTPWGDLLKLLRPDTIFYCAAERDERLCQKDPLRALAINAEVPANLARAMEGSSAKLVYFSTSKVFSGEQGDYSESDETHPLGNYGQSKARGEQMLAGFERVFTIRLGTLFGLGPVPSRSLFNRLLADIWNGVALPVIEDEPRSFHGVDWVAEAAERLLEADPGQAGLYHLTAAPKLSHYSFCVALGRALGASTAHLEPVPGETYSRSHPSPAGRGRDTSLAGDIFEATFGITPPSTAKSLKRLVETLKTGRF